MNSVLDSVTYHVSVGILSGIVFYFVHPYTKKPRKIKKSVEVYCFSHSEISCVPRFAGREQYTNEKYCGKKHMKHLIELLESTESSLFVCMALFTNTLLLETLIRIAQKGVTVNVIIGFKRENGFSQRLRDAGAKVFTLKVADSFMHNKFIVIDHSIAITGSVNWTDCSIYSNWEILVIFYKNQIAIEYEEIFNSIWHDIENL